MSGGPNHLDRRNATAATSGIAAAPGSPHTPRRQPASTYSSPGVGLRAEEEYIVIELGARYVSVGLAGDSRPKCILGFSQEESRRVGDYRSWLPGGRSPAMLTQISSWGKDRELWRMDADNVDLGLVEDKLERAIRDAYTRFLLQDSKAKRVILVIPSLLPQRLLGSTLSTLFRNFQPPGITILPIPTMTVLGAGQRSGLVIDIGWHETVVTAIYELREIKSGRTTRAMKRVTLAMAAMVDQIADGRPVDPQTYIDQPADRFIQYDFDQAEEIVSRVAWCKPIKATEQTEPPLSELRARIGSINLEDHVSEEDSSEVATTAGSAVQIPLVNSLKKPFSIMFEDLSTPVEVVLFDHSASHRCLDDEEHAVHFLVYELLTSLSPDVRALCMSNIIFSGGGSHVPGLRTRITDEIANLVQSRGWDPVWGKAIDEHRRRLKDLRLPDQNKLVNAQEMVKTTAAAAAPEDYDGSNSPPGYVEPPQDTIYDKIKAAAKNTIEQTSGKIRCIESLGPWAGASLVASLKGRGVVEVERESYLQHGLSGAHKESEINNIRSRQSMGANLGRSGVGESMGWTLGIWAA